ncbi:MAG: hypothetical protein AAFR35_08705 [Pseudomonadota bacterium]
MRGPTPKPEPRPGPKATRGSDPASAGLWVRLAVDGHFGEFLQGRLGPEGPVVLVTLPSPLTGTVVEARRASSLQINGIDGGPDPAALTVFLHDLGLPATGHFRFRARAEAGAGTGVSTATLVALARAAARLAGAPPPGPETLAQASLAVEGATDPLMLDTPSRYLWAPRRAAILEPLSEPPSFEIVGGLWGPPSPTNAADAAFPDIADLLEDWRMAVACRDLAGLAALARMSADRTRAHRSVAPDPLDDLARELGAMGTAIAHTGAARALLFAPETVPDDAEHALSEAGFRAVLRFRTPPC